jgi:BirA family transcriptional regulator, biotin operon repressor / biotin---[acetyl-CoA-carboxylase] ligase
MVTLPLGGGRDEGRISMGIEFEPLEQKSILDCLHPDARKELAKLIILQTVDSTNNYLAKFISNQVIACFAEQQTAGKGQHGKRWLSPPGGQIYFSLVWSFTRDANQILGLSLAIAVMVARALRQVGVGAGLAVKWPNDVYYHSKKLVGILVEAVRNPAGVYHTIIGVGLNFFLTDEQAATIDQPWTSLHKILQQKLSRNVFAGALLNEIILGLRQFSTHGLAAFQEEWRGLDYLYNQPVNITLGQQTLTGVMRGISARGELLLLDENQVLHECLNGTVRLA